jgi:hypothetical protein
VVTPTATELEVPWRVPFESETKALNKGAGCHVRWLNIRLESVQPKATKRVVEHQSKGFAHVPLSRERCPDLITEIRALKNAPSNLTELE